MSFDERFGTRDLTYSAWHRPESIKRYVGKKDVKLLTMIDIDSCPLIPWIEADKETYEPLALIETAEDREQNKPGMIIKNLAKRVYPPIPAIVVLYKKDTKIKIPDAEHLFDISRFRYRRLWPEPETSWRVVSPREWCEILFNIREWSERKLEIARWPMFNVD